MSEPGLRTVKVSDLKPHPVADIFPMLDENSVGFKALEEDIKANQLKQRIVLFGDQVLDGRHRLRVLEKLVVEELHKYEHFEEYTGNDPIAFVLSANLHRRHLNTAQRAMVAAKLASLEKGTNQHTKKGPSIEEAAKLLSVGHASVERAKKLLEKGDPWLVEQVEAGAASVSGALNQTEGECSGGVFVITSAPGAVVPKGEETTPPTPPGKKRGKRKNQTVITEPEKPTHANYVARLELMIEALREWPKGNLSLAEEWASDAKKRIDATIDQLKEDESEAQVVEAAE
jgi:hypothetical protein